MLFRSEDAVLEVGELPAREHASRVHRVAGLGLKRVPIGRDGGDEDAVSWLEVFDLGTNLHDLARRSSDLSRFERKKNQILQQLGSICEEFGRFTCKYSGWKYLYGYEVGNRGRKNDRKRI